VCHGGGDLYTCDVIRQSKVASEGQVQGHVERRERLCVRMRAPHPPTIRGFPPLVFIISFRRYVATEMRVGGGFEWDELGPEGSLVVILPKQNKPKRKTQVLPKIHFKSLFFTFNLCVLLAQ